MSADGNPAFSGFSDTIWSLILNANIMAFGTALVGVILYDAWLHWRDTRVLSRRSQAADQRDSQADRRDTRADSREDSANWREGAADHREGEADQRERNMDKRDRGE
jgi:hypothetical protein